MSEPQSPPPPPASPPQPPAKKKGLSPVAWILIGCLGLLILAGLGMGACGLFVAKKAKDFAGDMQENPGRTAAEMIVRLNPDLEIVGTDDAAETITIRSKKNGEEMTFDWSEIQQGNFSFSSDEGDFEFDASGKDDGAVITMKGPDGETTQIFGGTGDADVPGWIPMADGAADVQSTFSMQNAGTSTGAFTYSTTSSIADVASFYEEEFENDGFEVGKSSFSQGGRESSSVTGTRDNNKTTVTVAITNDGGDTQVTVTYTEGS